MCVLGGLSIFTTSPRNSRHPFFVAVTQPAAGSFQSSVSMRSDVEGGDFPRVDRLFFVGWAHTYDATDCSGWRFVRR